MVGCEILATDLETFKGDELTKRVYESGVNAVGVRGRPPIKIEDRVFKG